MMVGVPDNVHGELKTGLLPAAGKAAIGSNMFPSLMTAIASGRLNNWGKRVDRRPDEIEKKKTTREDVNQAAAQTLAAKPPDLTDDTAYESL